MKINKVIINILHFFGFANASQHIDYVKVLVCLSDLAYEDIYDKPTDILVTEIKSAINEKFKTDIKLERNCRKVKQVWAVLYKHEENRNKKYPIGYGSMVKQLYYDDGELFYPGYDDAAFKRRMKLNELGI